MLELLYTSLVIFGFFFVIFIISRFFKPIKITMLFAQLILCFILFSNNFYKKHSLWKEPDFINIHEVPYYPIKSINLNYYGELSAEKMNDREFSIIKTEEYSNECLENYFIKSYKECPITNIIIDNKINEKYENYTMLEVGNLYLYYTNNYKYGKLYEYNEYNNKNLNFSKHEFDYEKIKQIKKREDNKLLNPLIDLKYYSKYADFIILALLIFILFYIFIESYDDFKFSYFKITNIIIEVIIFILYLIRFIKFIKIKHLLLDNKDIYNDEDYTPNKVFNIDSFTVAFPLNILLFNILYIIFPNKCSVCKKNDIEAKCLNKYVCMEINKNKNIFIILLSLPFIFSYIIFPILEYISDLKIKKVYKNMIYNWNTSPIKSIELSSVEDYELASIKSNQPKKYSFYNWKENYFKIERLDEFDYMNLYKNKNGKKCGKDSYGNYLYFPENVDCPINDILITNSSINLTNYTKLYLGDNYFLCYTNKNIEGEILIDLKASSSRGVQLNLETTNEICEDYYESILEDIFFENPGEICKSFYNFSTIPFYKEIDEWQYMFFINIKDFSSYQMIYLYSINYLGINSTLIKEREIIGNFRKNMNIYVSFSICKFILFIFNTVFFFAMIIILICDNKKVELIYSIINSVIIIFYIIISIICLYINFKYIQNIMNKINKDFQNNKNEYGYNIIIIIYGFLLLLNYIIIILYSLFIDSEGNFNFRRNINPPLQNNQNIQSTNQNLNINVPSLREVRMVVNAPQISVGNNLPEININQGNNHNNQINNNNNERKIRDYRIDNNLNYNNLYPIKINRSCNYEINYKFYRQFEPMNKEPVKLKKGNNCVICQMNPSKIIFSPCSHRCICQDCYTKNKSKIKNCPICRKPIKDFLEKIYDV